MRKVGFTLTLALILSVIGISLLCAAPVVYVKNKPVAGAIPHSGEVYVTIESFLTAGGYSWELSNNVLNISDGPGKRPRIASAPSSYSYMGKVFSVHSFVVSGRPLVMAKGLASGLNLASRYTRSSDTYDYFVPGTVLPIREVVSPSPSVTGSPSPAASPTATPTPVTYKDAEVTKSVIKPTNNFFWDSNTNEIRGEVFFTNTDKQKITQVSVIFKICDGTGASLWTKRHDIGDMEAGASTQKFSYFWINAVGIVINENNFKYEISYLEPPKQPEAKAGGK